MAATVEIITVTSILLLILSRPVSLKFSLKTPKKYRIDFFLFAIEGKPTEKGKKRGRPFRISRLFGIFDRLKPRIAALRYLFRHSKISSSVSEEYDLAIDFYLFRLCIAALIALKYILERGIKRRFSYVGK